MHLSLVCWERGLGLKAEETTMPIYRAVNSSALEPPLPPKSRPAQGEEAKLDPDVSSEESASTIEERGNETPPATSSEMEPPKEPEAGEKAAKKLARKAQKEEKDPAKEKDKKLKTISTWATLSACLLARSQNYMQMVTSSHPKMDAIKASHEKGMVSVVAIQNSSTFQWNWSREATSWSRPWNRCQSGESSNRWKERGVLEFSGDSKLRINGSKIQRSEEEWFSRVLSSKWIWKMFSCWPSSASMSQRRLSIAWLKNNISQYYAKLKINVRPQLMKNALPIPVEKGQLVHITDKESSRSYQLKKSGEKPLLGVGLMEDSILPAVAINEPKTCCTAPLRMYVLEKHLGTN